MTIPTDDDFERLWAGVFLGEGLEAARRYAASMHGRPYLYYRQRVEAMGVSGERALDAGSGTGTWSFALASSFRHVDAIDKAADRIELARMIQTSLRIRNIAFAEGDILASPYPESHFDLIFCFGVVVSYLPLESVLAEFRRMLKPGGLLYVSLNGDGWLFYLKEVRGRDNPRDRQLGEQGLYRSLTERLLRPSRYALHETLKNSGDELVEGLAGWVDRHADPTSVRAIIRSGKTVEEIALCLAGSGGAPDALLADARGAVTEVVLGLCTSCLAQIKREVCPEDFVEVIRSSCGPAYLPALADDVLAIRGDPEAALSFRRAARAYEPDEVERACRRVGLGEFRWAEESKLFSKDLASYRGRYSGRLKVWEFAATKAG